MGGGECGVVCLVWNAVPLSLGLFTVCVFACMRACVCVCVKACRINISLTFIYYSFRLRENIQLN